jgi:hypothetical protein
MKRVLVGSVLLLSFLIIPPFSSADAAMDEKIQKTLPDEPARIPEPDADLDPPPGTFLDATLALPNHAIGAGSYLAELTGEIIGAAGSAVKKPFEFHEPSE